MKFTLKQIEKKEEQRFEEEKKFISMTTAALLQSESSIRVCFEGNIRGKTKKKNPREKKIDCMSLVISFVTNRIEKPFNYAY